MKKYNLANLPTRIEKMKFNFNGINVYIKRDDQTGFELSGNKVRKLEYSFAEAKALGADTVITCGGIQSNHCRATAIAAVKLGFEVHLVLKENEVPGSGNYFLNKMIGAKIHLISLEDYKNRHQIMADMKKDLDASGKHTYLIPEGASNGIGNLGYEHAFSEIENQENELGIEFDYIVSAFGSGSTYTGLLMGIKKHGRDIKNVGYNIYNPNVDGFDMVKSLLNESKPYTMLPEITPKDVDIRTDYVGRGYALSRDEEIDFILDMARNEGILLDSVYTGKAMYGLMTDIKNGKYKDNANILFIHTGGVFGNFSKMDLFIK
ncbi:D-cysteine desulfhydrase family protein [Acidaminobacter sp. JC074]|uniref:1-aminocyclopropane-1-carboxylate deaminase/D-cysteine desulfhydrase n=1 Tax=Acidaminobacter sp. JC074 TaxID=2530199 RepID=UPI001F0F3967|nr:D-cysteine desulfhydrase family protein [Acidaminobacter sp. JC074]MCH4888289.1 D-cysteine desulfhydrase family protein [Acidaminobacter sp. JC074]